MRQKRKEDSVDLGSLNNVSGSHRWTSHGEALPGIYLMKMRGGQQNAEDFLHLLSIVLKIQMELKYK
jgi:hypothetical protein